MNPNMPPNMPPPDMSASVPPNFRGMPNLFRALRGPVMMITLGCVLAFDHFSKYDFSDTWPLLLIVFGAMTLGEHLIGRGQASPYTGA